MRACLFIVAVAAQLAFSVVARADDVADEADLQFSLGAERYQVGDFRGALAHFLASHRLAKNPNVAFNVGRSYERLSLFPEAYRWYSQALDGHASAAARTEAEKALGRIQPNVAVVRIQTDPPGATLYLGRKDLGPRGDAPRALGLAPGSYRVIAELPGHEPAAIDVPDVVAGTVTVVTLRLAPQPGRLVGSLVVSTDEPGARVAVAGKSAAFTPAIVPLPAGRHTVTLARDGFRVVERVVDVRAGEETKLEVALVPNDEVTAASRVREALEDAPSSVSIVPSQELRAMAYPTIAEALRGVRGVYTSDDRSYASLGIRGMGRLGSYGNRVLVLVDGHPTNDNWVGSSYVGYDARTDLEDVDHIEVLRGPGSVVYGTNAFSGVVNVVTRRQGAPVEVGLSTHEYGVTRGRARGTVSWGPDAGLWVSVSGARAAGRDYFFPEYAGESPTLGNARGADGFDAETFTGRVWYKSLSAQWLLHARSKRVPTGQFETLLADGRARQRDTRGLLEVRFDPKLGDSLALSTRAHANLYLYRGDLPRPAGPGLSGVERDSFDGAWFGLEQRAVVTAGRRLRLTAGGEVQNHTRVVQRMVDDEGTWLDDSRPYTVSAGYLLADVEASPRVRASAGARLDHYSTFGSSLNPRVSLVVKPSARDVVKLMGGKAFRAPSVYELFYNDGGVTQRANPRLAPESVYTTELEWSHRLSPTVVGVASTWASLARNLVVQRGGGTESDPTRYENSGSPVGAIGGEAEVRREWRQGWMMSGSIGAQRSRYLRGASARDVLRFAPDPSMREVANSPALLGAVRAAMPVLGRAATLATRVSFVSQRHDRHEDASDPIPQGRTDAALIWDLVLSGQDARSGVGWALGAYNLGDWRYTVPLSTEFRQRSLVQPGRTVVASVTLSR